MSIKAVVLKVDEIDISGGLYLPNDGAGIPTVCVCHGIPSGRPPDQGVGGYPQLAESICGEGFGVFIFNFRGTGYSGGNLDMPGWTRDLKAIIDYLSGLPEIGRLSLLGFSAGAAVSVCVAAKDSRVSCVAACACPAEFISFIDADEPQSMIDHFCSIGAIRDTDFPSDAQEWQDGFKQVRPIEYIAGIAPRPLLLVHGSEDETVDISHAHRLYDSAGELKRIVIIEGAGHRLRQEAGAMAAVLDWLKSRC